MKSSEEMLKSLLNRREQYEKERKKRRKRIVGISVPTGCCALILCAVFLLPGMKDNIGSGALPIPTAAPDMPMTDSSAIMPENPEPVTDAGEPDVPNVEADDGGTASPPDLTPKTETVGSEEVFFLWWKNRLSVTWRLNQAIESDPEGTFTVIANYRPTTGDITDFTYEGRTLSQWATEAVEADLLPDKMAELLKMGDALKYGEALYETGTPEGEKWDRRLYEDKIAYYGEELLNRYIVDGEFLREALENDLHDMKNTALALAEEAYGRAYAAYLDEVMPEFVQVLTAGDISCGRMTDRNSCLLLTVTAEELENLPLENVKDWYFDLLRG